MGTLADYRGMVIRASQIGEAWRLSFWDSMILAADEPSQAARVFSQVIAGVGTVNPFL